MSDELRLRGQQVSIRIVQAGTVVDSIDSISSFNDEDTLEIKEDGFLGEFVNRFQSILNGHGADFEFQTHNARWLLFRQSVLDKVMGKTPDVVFNVVRTDYYFNGDTVVQTYVDVHWGPMGKAIASRGDVVKHKLTFKCSAAPADINALP